MVFQYLSLLYEVQLFLDTHVYLIKGHFGLRCIQLCCFLIAEFALKFRKPLENMVEAENLQNIHESVLFAWISAGFSWFLCLKRNVA